MGTSIIAARISLAHTAAREFKLIASCFNGRQVSHSAPFVNLNVLIYVAWYRKNYFLVKLSSDETVRGQRSSQNMLGSREEISSLRDEGFPNYRF